MSYKKILAREFLILVTLMVIAGLVYLGTLIYNSYVPHRNSKLTRQIIELEKEKNSILGVYKTKSKNLYWLHERLMEDFYVTDDFFGSWVLDFERNIKLGGVEAWWLDLLEKEESQGLSVFYANTISKVKSQYSFDEVAEGLRSKDKRNKLHTYLSKNGLEETFDHFNLRMVELFNGKPNDGQLFLQRSEFSNFQELKTFIQDNLIDEIDEDSQHRANKLDTHLTQLKVSKLRSISSENQRSYIYQSLLYLGAFLFGLRYFFYAIQWSIKTLKQTE